MPGCLTLFDCDVSYGIGAVALPRELPTPAALLAEMDHSGIARALTWHRDAWERGFQAGNARIIEDTLEHPRLMPVLTFVPSCCDEMPTLDEFLALICGTGTKAVRAFPVQHCFCLDSVACGDLLSCFTAFGIPLLVPFAEFRQGWPEIYALLRNYPALTLIVTETGCWGEDRYFRPLMKRYPNFHISMNRLETAGQLASLVNAVGHEHILFGSGLPRNYAGGFILSLLRAPISDEAREAIAHGNLERLLAEPEGV